jgi:hypothetical protein
VFFYFHSEGGCWTSQEVNGTTSCVNICQDKPNDPTIPPEECSGTYNVSRGYTIVTGDTCSPTAEESFGDIVTPCDGTYVYVFDTWFAWITLLVFLTLILVLCLITALVTFYRTNEE